MKIEKISENQIRCTLTSSDLNSRQIQLSELAYGSDKAKHLFQDMMLQAHTEFGFNSDNSPLMIEAIPTSSDSIVLIITKVDDPEELDTRFSRFTQPADEVSAAESKKYSGAEDILDLFHKIRDAQADAASGEKNKKGPVSGADSDVSPRPSSGKKISLLRSFTFSSLDDVIRAAHGLNHFYDGDNTLYRTDRSGTDGYQLILHQSGCTPEDFNKICNILSEFASSQAFSPAGEAYLKEHGDALIRSRALQTLNDF